MSPTIPELPVLIGNGRDESHPVPQSQVTMTQLMAPQDTNLMGNVFGGVILAAVDRIAYVCATRHAGRPCVTASFDQVDFRSPIQIGEVVTVRQVMDDGIRALVVGRADYCGVVKKTMFTVMNYILPEMGEIWSDQRKLEAWKEVEVAALEVVVEDDRRVAVDAGVAGVARGDPG